MSGFLQGYVPNGNLCSYFSVSLTKLFQTCRTFNCKLLFTTFPVTHSHTCVLFLACIISLISSYTSYNIGLPYFVKLAALSRLHSSLTPHVYIIIMPIILFFLLRLWFLFWATYDRSPVCHMANTNRQTVIHTHIYGHLESSVNLTPLAACLWTVGGKKMQTPHRKALTWWWSRTQDVHTVRQH